MDTVDNVELPVDWGEAEPRPPVPDEALPATKRKKKVKPVYRKLKKPKVRVDPRCDDCMALYANGTPPPGMAAKAKWERRVTGEGSRQLCYEHVRHWRDRDGLGDLREDRLEVV